MQYTTRACLFISKDGGFAVRFLDSPLREAYEIPPVPPGMWHAIRVLGLTSTIRKYKRTIDGGLPVYEET